MSSIDKSVRLYSDTQIYEKNGTLLFRKTTEKIYPKHKSQNRYGS